jgi:hypothetical protein
MYQKHCLKHYCILHFLQKCCFIVYNICNQRYYFLLESRKKKLKYFARLGASIVMLATTTTLLIMTVNAEIVTEAKTVHVTKRKGISLVTNKEWTKRLAHAGYVFELLNAGSGALIKLNNKAYSKKVLKKIVKQNTLFKVTRLATVGNGIVVFLRSQNGKYRGSTNYVVGISITRICVIRNYSR